MEAFQLLRLYFDWKSGLQFKSHIRVIDKVSPPLQRTHQQESTSLKDYGKTSAAVCLQPPPKTKSIKVQHLMLSAAARFLVTTEKADHIAPALTSHTGCLRCWLKKH